MAREEIIEKLGGFFRAHPQFADESEVVYLFVEIRKLIDKEGSSQKYSLLKFYCDWSVHSRKDKITDEIRSVMNTVYEEFLQSRSLKTEFTMALFNFVGMSALKHELSSFLVEHSLDVDFLEEKNWNQNVLPLIHSILVDQPLVNPHEKIKYFNFTRNNIDGRLSGFIEIEALPALIEKVSFAWGPAV